MDSMEFNELFNLLQNDVEMDRIEAKSAAHGIGKSFLISDNIKRSKEQVAKEVYGWV